MVNTFSWLRLFILGGLFICAGAVLTVVNTISGLHVADPYNLILLQVQSVSALSLLPAATLIDLVNYCFGSTGEPLPLRAGMDPGSLALIGYSAFINAAGVFIGLLPGLCALGWCSLKCAQILKHHYVFALRNPINLLNGCCWLRGFSLLFLSLAAAFPSPRSAFVTAAAFCVLTVCELFIIAFRHFSPY